MKRIDLLLKKGGSYSSYKSPTYGLHHTYCICICIHLKRLFSKSHPPLKYLKRHKQNPYDCGLPHSFSLSPDFLHIPANFPAIIPTSCIPDQNKK
ncbi:unnamed protein product [Lactuca virosa]|uniref:Uncharacterized protein n=1 Tax=Lactuca virosa TaxID=75947 RepID=A0AAU9MAK1_9ASTR|nr:unnamed protein product [Lactuca virosa]